jgi:hypothetical protein
MDADVSHDLVRQFVYGGPAKAAADAIDDGLPRGAGRRMHHGEVGDHEKIDGAGPAGADERTRLASRPLEAAAKDLFDSNAVPGAAIVRDAHAQARKGPFDLRAGDSLNPLLLGAGQRIHALRLQPGQFIRDVGEPEADLDDLTRRSTLQYGEQRGGARHSRDQELPVDLTPRGEAAR